MKIAAFLFPVAILSASFGIPPTDTTASVPVMAGFDCSLFRSAVPQKSGDSAALEAVLRKMDAVSASFHTAEADFEWDNYQKVIDDMVDVETGSIYYRRVKQNIEMMADVKKSGPSAAEVKPDAKFILFSEGKVRMYTPKTEQEMVYDLGKNRAAVDSFLVLGFGGSGEDLQKQFDVTYAGDETVNGVKTAKLNLVPKSDKVRDKYNRMILWIDPDKGVSVQQQFFTPQGDYRLCKYSAIRMNGKINDDVFRLKTTGKTQIVSPTG